MESKPTTERKPRAKKKTAKRKYVRKPKPPQNLPEPIEINQPKEEAPQASEDLLASVRNLFSGQPQSQPEAQQKGSSFSHGSSVNDYQPLSDESERLLSQVPESIADEGQVDGGAAQPQSASDDAISALMAQVAFEPQDVQDTLGELFDWLADRFESEHWKLTERQARMLGRPTAQLLNSLWAKLRERIPDILTRWCDETPGAMAFLMACGLVITPKVMQQVSLSRKRTKEKKPTAQPQSKPVQPIHVHGQQPPRVGMVYERNQV